MATEKPIKPEEQATPTPPVGEVKPDANLTPEALSDGTVPTILTESDGTASKALIGDKDARVVKLYRRADIATSFITVVVTLAIVGLIIGLYIFFGPKKKVVPAPKITTLDQSEITKLGGFLTGNGLGSAGTVLTVSSSSLFKSRLAVDSDLKVTGNAEIGGNLSSSNLSVTKNTTLASTSINGPLTVTGPTVLQSPATLAGGASIGNNLAVAGNGTFGGAVSAGSFNARNLTVTGDLNLSGHLVISGPLPTVTADVGAGSSGRATVEGNDSGGTITITTGTVGSNSNTNQVNGILTFVNLKFHTSYSKTPHVLLTPVGGDAGSTGYYVLQTASSFTINLTSPARSASTYAYNYWVIQ